MKLSLKEFFVREAKSSTKHSSVNIEVKSSAQVNIKEAHPADRLRAFAGLSGIKDEPKKSNPEQNKSGLRTGIFVDRDRKVVEPKNEADFDNDSPAMRAYYKSLRGAEYDPEYMKTSHFKGDPWARKPVPPAGSGNPEPSTGRYRGGDFVTDDPKQDDFDPAFEKRNESGEEKWPGDTTFEPQPEGYEFDFDIAYDAYDQERLADVAAQFGVKIDDVNPEGPGGGNPQVFATAPDQGTARDFLTALYGEPPEWMEEAKLSSYEHPHTHLAKKFSKQKGVKDPWALAQSVASKNESFLREYEDPTSSKHASDDSKWAGPFSDSERMPHEVPHSAGQESSSDAWKQMRKDGPKSSSKLKDFFGGSPFPKTEDVEKMSEGGKGSGRKKGSKNKPRDEWGNVVEPAKSAAEPAGEIPDELPDEWVADEPKSSAKSSASPAGGEEPDIDWDSLDDEDFIDKLASAEKGPEVKTQAAPPKMKDTVKSKPAEPKGPEYDFSGPVQKDVWSGENENEQTWDEVRATAPQEAARMERDFSPEELKGARFRKRHDGRIYMMTTSGQRYSYLGPKLGWEEMDDGETPSGDF